LIYINQSNATLFALTWQKYSTPICIENGPSVVLSQIVSTSLLQYLYDWWCRNILNKVRVGDGLDGGNLLSMLTGSGKEVSGTGLLGGTLEVDLDSGLGGLSLGSLVGNLAGKDLLLALRLADVLDADVDALLKDAAIDELVHTDTDGGLGNVEDDTGAAVVVLVGHTLVDGGISEDVNVVTDLDGHHVLGEVDGSLLPEILGKHVARARAGSE